jgi:hypothetical protein
MEGLFEAWSARSKATQGIQTKEQKEDSNHFNKNDKNMLQGILMVNHKYQKRPIDEEFMLKQRESKGTEVIEGIAPYTTDKSKIFNRLEEDRDAYKHKKKLKANNEED